MTNIIKKEPHTLPNKAFDSEYSTQFRKEYLYLLNCGIEPSFIKKTGEYRIKTYKYTKTPELFKSVAAFYEEQRNEKQFNELKSVIDKTSNDFRKFVNDVNAISPDILQGGVCA